MTPYQSATPFLVRVANRGGWLLRRLYPWRRFDADQIMERAARRAGAEDFGDSGFTEGLNRLLRAYEDDADLTPIGRVAMNEDVVQTLVNRLQIEADRKRYPAIAKERIAAPIFIAGLPRSGTTFLHGLLAQDPDNRSPLGWQAMYPSPPPDGNSKADARIARAQRRMDKLDWLAPAFKVIHPVSAVLPQECIVLTAPSFESYLFQTICHVPSYQRWLERRDLAPSYRYHRRFLQQLQYRTAGQRWVLKAPAHLFAIDAILEVYPDARIVQTHRDPLVVMASMASLTATLRGAFSDRIDPVAIGREMMDLWVRAVAKAARDRAACTTNAQRFVDIRYEDLIRDPLGAVERLYDHYGLTLSGTARTRMEAFLARHPKDKHGVHHYDLASFSIDPEEVRERFATYCETFGI